MRVVLDTNVIVSAFRSPSGASAAALLLARRGRVTLLSSVGLFLEYEAVITRKEHLEAAHATPEQAANFLKTLAATVEPIDIYFLWRPRLKDPDDDMVLETAANGNADAIVTFNAKDFHGIKEQFGVNIATPVDLLRSIRNEIE